MAIRALTWAAFFPFPAELVLAQTPFQKNKWAFFLEIRIQELCVLPNSQVFLEQNIATLELQYAMDGLLSEWDTFSVFNAAGFIYWFHQWSPTYANKSERSFCSMKHKARVWISSWQCNIYALDCEVQLSDRFKTIERYLLVRWKPRYLWNQVFKVPAKLMYETEQLPLKNIFVCPLVYLSARLETSWTLKQGPDSLQSANLFNLHSKAAKAISANKEKKIRLSQADKS